MASIGLGLVLAVSWMVAVMIWGVTDSNAARSSAVASETQACTASTSILSAVQLVPFKLRVADVLEVVPTLEAAYNIRIRFFETDYRTTNRFSLMPGVAPNTFTGDTNWMSECPCTREGGSPVRATWQALGCLGGGRAGTGGAG
jgi:hypothetical protein